jgi:ribosome maturation factor RimP
MNWMSVVESTVNTLGYDAVELERSSKGLLRVFIDRLDGAAVTIDDCEGVTRQLQRVLEVEGVDYQRLEVSSPGLDRPLKKPADWQRFAGAQVELTLRAPLAGRRKFSGELQSHGGAWRLLMRDGEGKAASERALDFSLEDVREARLVPVLDFKRPRPDAPPSPADAGAPGEARRHASQRKGREAAAPMDGGQPR